MRFKFVQNRAQIDARAAISNKVNIKYAAQPFRCLLDGLSGFSFLTFGPVSEIHCTILLKIINQNNL